MKNYFIVVEGLDGSGKTTAINTITKILNNNGIKDIILTREPGGTPIAEKLRKLIKYNIKGDEITNKTELLMLYAARVQLIEKVIKPALEKGKWVIGDRHDLSSQAYQSGGRNINQKLITYLSNMVIGKFKPTLTLYLDLPPKIGLKRILSRRKIDRIEKEQLSFFVRTRARYLEIASTDSSIITIDANQNLKQVQHEIYKILNQWLKIYK
ncbi:Thymidylate kinase [Candidatus Providencia siddallii]|uniref:Thymidylate kinase n=1 Tax=Candidatus Providencia siddallii TaxID=1715285 RepID=A0A0M6W937_9GAMM|nr:Thymidylate kinase [Candidatus Providencia siddallii]